MPQSQIPAFAEHDGQAVHTIPEHAVLASSASLRWSGMIVEHYRHAPMEMPAMVVPNHHLTVQLNPPVAIERKLDGRWRTKRTAPGSFTLTPASMLLQARWQAPLEVLAIALAPDFIAAAVPEVHFPHSLIPQFAPVDPHIDGLSHVLLAELHSGGRNGALFAESVGTALAIHILQHYHTAPLTLQAPQSLAPNVLGQIIEYIHAHYHQSITLSQLAAIAGVSMSHFRLLFKHSTGETPYRYIQRFRVAQARNLLIATHLPLGEVALRTGFADQSHMTHQVRKIIGVTPGTLRKQQH
jgi:AraC family transcriptional regulator